MRTAVNGARMRSLALRAERAARVCPADRVAPAVRATAHRHARLRVVHPHILLHVSLAALATAPARPHGLQRGQRCGGGVRLHSLAGRCGLRVACCRCRILKGAGKVLGRHGGQRRGERLVGPLVAQQRQLQRHGGVEVVQDLDASARREGGRGVRLAARGTSWEASRRVAMI